MMLHLIHANWLWFFGALALGLPVGWLTFFRPATRWTFRPAHISVSAVTIGAILAIATAVPVRYGYIIDRGVILAILGTGGCFIGWALRDLAEFMPAAARPVGASAATTGSYLFRDAFAGMGAGTAYLRMPAANGSVSRERLEFSTRAIKPAPATGGYTFPRTLPFADATKSRRAGPVRGLRPHWSWPQESEPPAPPPS